jgi:hypothetical protein
MSGVGGLPVCKALAGAGDCKAACGVAAARGCRTMGEMREEGERGNTGGVEAVRGRGGGVVSDWGRAGGAVAAVLLCCTLSTHLPASPTVGALSTSVSTTIPGVVYTNSMKYAPLLP